MKFVFACGGTGGHIFPAIGVAEELKKRSSSHEILFLGGRKELEGEIFRSAGILERIHPIESAPFLGLSSLWRPAFLIKLIEGFRQSMVFLKKEKPDLVAGFGGYVSFPAVMAAKFLGIPTLVHEQNVIPGMANRVLCRVADATAVSFPETLTRLPRRPSVQLTGNPVREAIEKGSAEEAYHFFGFSPERPTLLVLGGSQGAESINWLFLSSLGFLTHEMKKNFQVLHLCGRMSAEAAQAILREQGVAARVFSFFSRMDLAYAVTDLALGRAGATFLAEVAEREIPCILVPYPYAGGHQRENARVFAEGRSATVCEQAGLSPEKLARILSEKILKNGLRAKSPAAGRAPAGTARHRLADFMLETVSR